MAVILKGGASRNTTTTTTDSVPLRSSTVTINQAGLVTSKTGANGAEVNVLNLGYRGDNKVTRLYVKLWKNASVFSANYLATIVFYQEANKVSQTLSMSNNGTYFFTDIPENITQLGGNYQIHFVLKERIGNAQEGAGIVGQTNDPAYREVFISESFKGTVDNNSGFSLLPGNFDWETDLYDYEKGYIAPAIVTWNEIVEDEKYSANIYLAGAKTTTILNDIEVELPAGVSIDTSATNGGISYDSQTLSLYVILDSSVNREILDDIQITYPVIFSAKEPSAENAAQKLPIKVIFEPSSVSVDKTQNINLGMKMDAYSTAINMSSLWALPADTEKYAIFSKDNKTVVCKAVGSYCWIPTVVTGKAGTWEVSFVSKGKATVGNTTYVYYTGILKLPVVDNVLNKADLATDTSYKVVLDQDGKTLYDQQEYALYAISEADANAKLDYTATIINHAIGWAYGISEYYSADEVVESINQFNEVHSSYNKIAANITVLQSEDVNLQGQIDVLTAADTTLDNKIETLKADIQKLDVTAMQEVVSGHTEQIASLISKTDSLEDKDEELAQADEELDKRVTTNETDIKGINQSILEINVQLAETKAVASTNSGNIADHTNKIISLRTDVNEINRVIEPYKSYGELITGEIEDRVEGDKILQSAIQTEVERATKVANDLQSELDATQVDLGNTQEELAQLTKTVESNKEAIEKSLEAESKAREAADFNLSTRATELERVTSSHSEEIKSIETRVDSIADDKTIIRNEYILGEPKIFVAKIILVQPASLDELAQMSNVEYTTEEEKNAFKQELIDAGIITNEQNLENLSAEQVIETLRLKKKTEANTLYLVQEEE